MKPATAAALLLPLVLLPTVSAADTTLLQNSPFSQTGTPSSSADSPLEQLEFSGVTVIGKEIFVSVIDKKTRKGGWMPLKNEGKEGLVVESYDAKKDEVVVRLGAETKVLSLRMATVKIGKALPPPPAGPPVPAAVPPPVAPVLAAAPPAQGESAPAPAIPPKSPEVEAQEREARMLVSDLLEIGMIQRKAYEQKKAAEEEAARRRAAGGR
jgi:hypothetical protein